MTGESVTYAAAEGGGVLSFLSPCVLPIVPAYLSVITGLDVTKADVAPTRHLARVGRDTGLFIAGFSAVFDVLGMSATTVGRTVLRNQLLVSCSPRTSTASRPAGCTTRCAAGACRSRRSMTLAAGSSASPAARSPDDVLRQKLHQLYGVDV